jgi:hypothetical protein
MSVNLERCTRGAFLTALARTLSAWVEQVGEAGLEVCSVDAAGDRGPRRLVLPFRPLILGGDDVTLLAHSSWTLPFVQTMAAEFQERSRRAADQSEIRPLWPATGDRLSISAGILFAKTTFPLHMAIPCADSLLASAKGRYRTLHQRGEPAPAAVDWEAVTETLVDTPADRRNRELRFADPETASEASTIEIGFSTLPVVPPWNVLRFRMSLPRRRESSMNEEVARTSGWTEAAFALSGMVESSCRRSVILVVTIGQVRSA